MAAICLFYSFSILFSMEMQHFCNIYFVLFIPRFFSLFVYISFSFCLSFFLFSSTAYSQMFINTFAFFQLHSEKTFWNDDTKTFLLSPFILIIKNSTNNNPQGSNSTYATANHTWRETIKATESFILLLLLVNFHPDKRKVTIRRQPAVVENANIESLNLITLKWKPVRSKNSYWRGSAFFFIMMRNAYNQCSVRFYLWSYFFHNTFTAL